ncbi:putative immunity protein [Gordonia neofelifaecis]|uniref:putative immunity protein n=1 Tax=Gordonia neofelifaecis TaxID=945692 RepID=UPI0006806EC8|nr:hypothetical protein [Gordonia neofelifaecis]
MASIQTLSDSERRTVARWALACAEHVLPLFSADTAAEEAISDAIARTRAYSAGEGRTADEIAKRFVAGKAARAATTPAGAAAARSVAQASAVAHMGAHALGAAAYAAKAVSLAHKDRPDLVEKEVRWQLDQLTEPERVALRRLPPLGNDSSGPLAPGLLSQGVLGTTIREIQAQL